MRVVALWAAVAVPLSYAIFVQVNQIERAQRLTSGEAQGSVCLAQAHAILDDIFALAPSGKKMARQLQRDASQLDGSGCSKGLRGWPVLRSQIGHAAFDEAEIRHLGAAMVTVINAIGDVSNLVYDSHPAVLNLANAFSYDLPKAQSLIVSAASVRDVLASARLEATAEQLIYFTRYDTVTATSYAPSLASILAGPMKRSLLSERAYNVALEKWQRLGAHSSAHVTSVAAAERRALDDTDRVDRAVYRAANIELSAEAAENRARLRSQSIVYGSALVLALGIAWLIVLYRTRRGERELLRLQQEMSRVRAEAARANAELELGIREARFQAIFAKSPLAIAIGDLHASVIECNEAYLAIVGSAAPAGRARTVLDTLTVEPADALDRIYADFRNGSTATQQVDLLLTDGQRRIWSHAIVAPVTTSSGPAEHCSIMLQDITERIEREQRFEHVAMHDYLTGLPNRASMIGSLAEMFERSGTATPRFALLFVDVDDFKSINDTLGHGAGDEALKSIANTLPTLVRDSDTVTRYGGDEFVILLVNPSSIARADTIVDRIASAFQAPITVGDASITISLSVGVIVDRIEYESVEHVLADADAAMYQRKVAGRKRLTTIRRALHVVPG